MKKKDTDRIEFTREMKKTYKLLFPNMCEVHFKILQNVLISYGYNVELLTTSGQCIVDEGLKYVHNDTCYPALLTIGQMINALKSGKYDVDHTALMMTQTGGGCRASNYIFLLRKALKNAGLGQVPVVSLNVAGLEKNSGFKITVPLLRRALAAVAYGDLLTLLANQTRPYEIIDGDTDRLIDKWVNELSDMFRHHRGIGSQAMRRRFDGIVRSFDDIPVNRVPKVKVGIVGEIYAKYCPLANNDLELFLREQGCEVMVPGLLGFFIYMADNKQNDYHLYGESRITFLLTKIARKYLCKIESCINDTVRRSGNFFAPAGFERQRELASEIIGVGCKMGEGWFLTGEMLELTESGYGNIVCAQPFGCLPNHIVGKGMIRKIREKHPDSNIVAVDYDPGATRVNQENRIKLMLAVARERLQESLAEENTANDKKSNFAANESERTALSPAEKAAEEKETADSAI